MCVCVYVQELGINIETLKFKVIQPTF